MRASDGVLDRLFAPTGPASGLTRAAGTSGASHRAD